MSYGKSTLGSRRGKAEKKLRIWNEVIEKANSENEGNKNVFWEFLGRRTNGRKKGMVELRSSVCVSITSTKGKLEVLKLIIGT